MRKGGRSLGQGFQTTIAITNRYSAPLSTGQITPLRHSASYPKRWSRSIRCWKQPVLIWINEPIATQQTSLPVTLAKEAGLWDQLLKHAWTLKTQVSWK